MAIDPKRPRREHIYEQQDGEIYNLEKWKYFWYHSQPPYRDFWLSHTMATPSDKKELRISQ